MKILVVHQYYLFPGAAGGSRFNEFARLWSDAGHEVTVVAGSFDASTRTTPAELKGRWVTETWDGPVRVLRCHVPESYGKSYRGRMWAFAGWTVSASAAWARVPRPDVVIATSPPLIAVIPGYLLARAHRRPVPWVFEMRDLWPESAVTTGVLDKDAALTKLLYALERWGARKADRVNVLTPAFREDLTRRGLAPDEKIWFVPNGADLERFEPGPRDNEVRRRNGWADRFVVLYAGAHGRANALSQLVETAERLKGHPDILIACVGDGTEREGLEQEARRRGLDNLRFYGAVPKAEMPDWINAADVGAAVLQDNPTFRTVYPNKVFDYMACARPTLLAIDGIARKLVVDDAQAGVFAPPERPAELAAAILCLKNDPAGRDAMGRRGRAWVAANASRDGLAARYLELLTSIRRAS